MVIIVIQITITVKPFTGRGTPRLLLLTARYTDFFLKFSVSLLPQNSTTLLKDVL